MQRGRKRKEEIRFGAGHVLGSEAGYSQAAPVASGRQKLLAVILA